MARYTDIPIFQAPQQYKIMPKKRYYGTTKYPEVPLSFEDIYVTVEIGDRFDQLALQYYGEPSFWWIISIANGNFNQGSYFPTPGSQIRIPSQIGPILAQFKELNEF